MHGRSFGHRGLSARLYSLRGPRPMIIRRRGVEVARDEIRRREHAGHRDRRAAGRRAVRAAALFVDRANQLKQPAVPTSALRRTMSMALLGRPAAPASQKTERRWPDARAPHDEGHSVRACDRADRSAMGASSERARGCCRAGNEMAGNRGATLEQAHAADDESEPATAACGRSVGEGDPALTLGSVVCAPLAVLARASSHARGGHAGSRGVVSPGEARSCAVR